MAAGKLFISKKSYKTYKNTDKTPEFMPSNFFSPPKPSKFFPGWFWSQGIILYQFIFIMIIYLLIKHSARQ